MVIKSQAGDFHIEVSHFEVSGRHLVLVGKMGVWDAQLLMGPREILTIVRKLLCKPATLFYLLRVPLTALRKN